ncbi:hydroxymethylglutaryl-CoA lyase [Ralstonia sp. GP73]|uniref:hydroxymethylglutaryl-CoA lyase n=1 Tax=unclassified Ralstonia TaxID=209769 RepID=UPI00247696C2|nr:hydroxymethylglutaryl-CoA lyase [Ralstonia sp. GP73]MDH6642490.1 hydroxymethylglutaryl-CoA lyase [Ralstonia sp. GP73]
MSSTGNAVVLNGQGKRVFIQEVATRDGFQIEPRMVPTQDKIALIDRLSQCGLSKIEVTSFTSPKAIPTLADAEDVMRGIARVPGVTYAALVPNMRGAERAVDCDVDELNLVMSVSETHNLANLRMTPGQSFQQAAQVAAAVRSSRTSLNLSLSCAFGCPMEGQIPTDTVLTWAARAVEAGIGGITLCDTTGMAWPSQVFALCSAFRLAFPQTTLTVHLHNTRGMALANVLAALQAGVDRFDGALGGLGGCPYAPGASGNVCTEDMVHMLELLNYDTGTNLGALLEASRLLPGLIGHDTNGQVAKAGRTHDLHPTPDYVETARQHALSKAPA